MINGSRSMRSDERMERRILKGAKIGEMRSMGSQHDHEPNRPPTNPTWEKYFVQKNCERDDIIGLCLPLRNLTASNM